MVRGHSDTVSWWLHQDKNLGPMNLSPETSMLFFKFTKKRDNMNMFSEFSVTLRKRETEGVRMKTQALCNSGAGWGRAI